MQVANVDNQEQLKQAQQNRERVLVKDLSAVSLLKDLSSAELRLIGSRMKLRQLKAGTALLVQGKPVESVFFIRKGLVDILVNNDRVAQRGSMDSLGEMSCLSGEGNASATARAVTPGQVWMISRRDFMDVVNAIPSLRSMMFNTITSRLQTLSHRFSEILKHIPHGIIKIDLQGIITDEFSSRCTDYLGINHLAGKNLGTLLFADSTALNEKWDHALRLFKDNSQTNINDRLNRLPDEVNYRHPDGNLHVFKLFYHLTADEKGLVNGLDIGIDDVTQSRHFQTELSSFQNMVTNLEQLLIMIDTDTGLIIQETLSHSQLGQYHFPTWNNLKGKNVVSAILNHQDSEQLDHFQRWLKMLGEPFLLQSMSQEELIDLAPKFAFKTMQEDVMELSFMLNPRTSGTYSEVLGKFELLEEAEEDSQPFQYSTMELMEEVMTAEAEHQSGLSEALNEMQISLEIVQTQMAPPNTLATHKAQIAGLIHSVKGLAQSFRLSTIAEAAHAVENALSDALKSGQNPDLISQFTTSFKSLLSLIVVSKSLCNTEEAKDLGNCRDREAEIRIPLTHFQQIKQKLDSLVKDTAQEANPNSATSTLLQLRNEMDSLEMIKLSVVFSRLQRIVTDTAKLLDKPVEFKISEKSSILINIQIGHVLSTCLIQLIKNAVYHGIEAPGERRFLEKPEKAIIELIVLKNVDKLILCVKDDGKGINLQRTLEQAVHLDLLDTATAEHMRLNGQKSNILALLFEPGFSTAGSVSLISGRGVGMSMIKDEIENLGGTITIDSKENKGTSVSLTVPIVPGDVKVL
jgi:CRP-like cAMP-binding protein/signal transduction histidine kinase